MLNTNIQDQSYASDLIEKNTIEYAAYMLKNHFPNHIDGMKKVHRRIIWSLKDRSGSFSGALLISNTMAFHPYNDVAIYDTAVKMSQSFQTVFPLLELEGQNGSYAGDIAAHSRYVDFRLTEFCKDAFLKGIEMQTIPFELGEDLRTFEPEHFIPKVPTALLSYSETIGFGFKSLSFAYPMEIICDMVISYCSHMDKFKSEISMVWNHAEFAQKLIPFFPIRNVIRNKKVLEREYKKGNFNQPILLDGILKIIDNCTVMVTTIPFRNTIENLIKTILEIIRNKKDEFGKNIEAIKELSNNQTDADILIKFKKNVNLFEMVEKLKSVIRFTSELAPFPNFPIDRKIMDKTPIELLKEWYHQRYYSILGKKKYHQQKLINRKRQLEALLIVGNHTEDVIMTIRMKTEEECLREFVEKYKLSFTQSKYIRNSKISILSKIDIDKTKEEYDLLKDEIEKFLKTFSQINDEMIRDANYFKENYPTPQIGSYIPKYLGYVNIDNNGTILFENSIEMERILATFKYSDKTVGMFPKKIKTLFISNSLPNTVEWDLDILLPHISNIKTILIDVDKNSDTLILQNGFTFKLNGIYFVKGPTRLLHTKQKMIKSILSTGEIVSVDVENDIPLRSNITQQGIKTKSIYYYEDNDWEDKDFLLFSHSDRANTKICINKINKTTSSIMTYAGGNTTILGIFPIDEADIFLTLPNKAVCRLNGKSISNKIKQNKRKEVPISDFKIA